MYNKKNAQPFGKILGWIDLLYTNTKKANAILRTNSDISL